MLLSSASALRSASKKLKEVIIGAGRGADDGDLPVVVVADFDVGRLKSASRGWTSLIAVAGGVAEGG